MANPTLVAFILVRRLVIVKTVAVVQKHYLELAHVDMRRMSYLVLRRLLHVEELVEKFLIVVFTPAPKDVIADLAETLVRLNVL